MVNKNSKIFIAGHNVDRLLNIENIERKKYKKIITINK